MVLALRNWSSGRVPRLWLANLSLSSGGIRRSKEKLWSPHLSRKLCLLWSRRFLEISDIFHISMRLGLRYCVTEHVAHIVVFKTSPVESGKEGEDGIDRMLVPFVCRAGLPDVLVVLVLKSCNHLVDVLLRLLQLRNFVLDGGPLLAWYGDCAGSFPRSVSCALQQVFIILTIKLIFTVLVISDFALLLLRTLHFGLVFRDHPQQIRSTPSEIFVLILTGIL